MGARSSTGAAHATHLRVVDVLKRAPFTQMMDDKIIHELATCFQLVTYGKGAVIKNDPWLFFIVADGAIDISSLIPTSNRKHQLHEVLCQRSVGDYISFAAREQILGRLMEESGLRGQGGGMTSGLARKNLVAMLDLNRITADMFTGCTLLKLQRDRFFKLRARLGSRRVDSRNGGINHTRRFSEDETSTEPHSVSVKSTPLQRRSLTMSGPEKLSLLSSIIESDIVNYLFDIPFLDGVDQSRLVTLSNLCSYMFIRKGETLCQEGEVGDKFFICIRGTLQATVQSILRHKNTGDVGGMLAEAAVPRRHPVERKIQALKKMGPGAYFGEISLLFKIPRICSIVALTDALLVYIDRVAFCNFLKIVPEANLVLLEHVRLNFLDTLIKQGCAFLNAMSLLKRQELSFVSETIECFPGDCLIKSHATSSSFYIVLRGEVEVEYTPRHQPHPEDELRASTFEVLRIRPGEYFGHEAIILSEPSPISVRCLDHCLLLRLTPDVFYDFFTSTPALYAEFCIKCLRDKARPEHVMQHYSAHTLWAADCVNRRRQNELKLFESIEDFMWEADLAEENTHELALTVYLRFLAEHAPLCVHISPATLEKLEEELSSQDVDRNIFAATRSEILIRMEDDHFETFKQSPLFHEFLDTLHCPQTIYNNLTTKHMKRLDMSHTGSVREESVLHRRETLQLQDVEDSVSLPVYENRSKTTNSDSSKQGATSGRSYGRLASQKRYLVTAADMLQVPVAGASSAGRRKSRVDATGLNRAPSSLVSTTFVL